MTDQNRINEKLRAYWDKLRDEKAFPSERNFNPSDIEDIWDSCFLVHVADAKIHGGYRYAYLGQHLIEAFGDNYTDREVSAKLIDPNTSPIAKHFEQVTKTQAPIVVDDEFTDKSGMVIKYRSCMLPLGEAPAPANYIIGGIKWKAF